MTSLQPPISVLPQAATILLGSTSSSTTATLPVSQTFKNHTQERELRKQRLNKAVEQVLMISDDLENNCRATLGKICSTYNTQYEQLITSVNEMGSMEEYLRQTDSILQRIGDNFTFITDKLTSEE